MASKCTLTFFFLCFFFILIPLQRRELQMLHSFSLFVVLTRLRQKMTTKATFVIVFCSSNETRAEDNNKRTSSLSSIFFLTLQKTMTSLPTYHRLLQFKKKNTHTHKNLEEDDKPSSSTSSSTTQEEKP